MNVKEAVMEYQCSGCVGGPYEECFKGATLGVGCGGHCPGTLMSGVGSLFLGMPKGFNRLGPIKSEYMPLVIFEADQSFFDKLNVPVWKYLDEFGHTIVRGLSPRVNVPFLHVYLKDIRDKVDCYEITEADLKAMD